MFLVPAIKMAGTKTTTTHERLSMRYFTINTGVIMLLPQWPGNNQTETEYE